MQHTQLPNFWLPVATLQTEALVLGNGRDVESKKLSFMHKSRSRPMVDMIILLGTARAH